MRRRARDWRGLDRDEPYTDVSIVISWAQAAGSVADRPLPDACLTAHTTDSPSRPRPQLRAPYYRSTRSRSETPSTESAPARSHAEGFQAIDAVPSNQKRNRSSPCDPRACARRPSVTRCLWDSGNCALHRFTRSRFMATVRGVSVKLLRARPRVLGLSSDFRAPRPRCIRSVSTHPSSRPREPVTSCDPEPLRSLRFVLTPPGLEAPWAASPCLRHCCRKNREACTGRLGPADA